MAEDVPSFFAALFGAWSLANLTALLHALGTIIATADRDACLHTYRVVAPHTLPAWLQATLPPYALPDLTWVSVVQAAPLALAPTTVPAEAKGWARALVLVALWLSDVARIFCFATHAAMPVRAPARAAVQLFMPLLRAHATAFLEQPPTSSAAAALVHDCAAGLLVARIPVPGGKKARRRRRKKDAEEGTVT